MSNEKRKDPETSTYPIAQLPYKRQSSNSYVLDLTANVDDIDLYQPSEGFRRKNINNNTSNGYNPTEECIINVDNGYKSDINDLNSTDRVRQKPKPRVEKCHSSPFHKIGEEKRSKKYCSNSIKRIFEFFLDFIYYILSCVWRTTRWTNSCKLWGVLLILILIFITIIIGMSVKLTSVEGVLLKNKFNLNFNHHADDDIQKTEDDLKHNTRNGGGNDGDEASEKKEDDTDDFKNTPRKKMKIIYKESGPRLDFLSKLKRIILNEVLSELTEYLSELSVNFKPDSNDAVNALDDEKTTLVQMMPSDHEERSNKYSETSSADNRILIKTHLNQIIGPHIMRKVDEIYRGIFNGKVSSNKYSSHFGNGREVVEDDVGGDLVYKDGGRQLSQSIEAPKYDFEEIQSIFNDVLLELTYELFYTKSSEYRCCCKFQKGRMCNEKKKMPLMKFGVPGDGINDDESSRELIEKLNVNEMAIKHNEYIKLIENDEIKTKMFCWINVMELMKEEEQSTGELEDIVYQVVERKFYLYMFLSDVETVTDLSCTLSLTLDNIQDFPPDFG